MSKVMLHLSDMTESENYFKDWYASNGDELNAARRSRYRSDPEYKAKVLEQNRKARQKKRREKVEELRVRQGAIKARSKPAWKSAEIEVQGEKVTAFTVGAVAKALDCSVQALRLWERKGYIPETPHRYSKGDRLYTLEQIEELRSLLTEQGRIGSEKTKIQRADYVFKNVRFGGRKTVTKGVRLHRVGVLAKVLGRTVGSIDRLISDGVLPDTPFRVGASNHRLYTFRMIVTTKKALDKRQGKGDESLSNEVLKAWEKIGILGATIEE